MGFEWDGRYRTQKHVPCFSTWWRRRRGTWNKFLSALPETGSYGIRAGRPVSDPETRFVFLYVVAASDTER